MSSVEEILLTMVVAFGVALCYGLTSSYRAHTGLFSRSGQNLVEGSFASLFLFT